MLENMNFRTHLSTYVPCILFIITWLPTSGSLQIIAIGLLILVAALFVLLRAADISWIDLAILGGIFAFTIANAVLHTDTGFINPLMGLVTYSGAAFFFIRAKGGQRTIKQFLFCVAGVTIFEALLGMFQVILAQGGQVVFEVRSIGDWATGTTFSASGNTVYALKMLSQSLFLLVAWIYALRDSTFLNSKGRWFLFVGLVMGSLGFSFTSSLVITLLILVSILAFYVPHTLWLILRQKAVYWRKEILPVVIWTTGVLANTLILQPQFAGSLLDPAGYVDSEPQESPDEEEEPTVVQSELTPYTARRTRVDRILYKLDLLQYLVRQDLAEAPQNVILGHGLGRYSSRAAMMLTGEFLESQPSWFPISMSPEMQLFANQYWTWEDRETTGGTFLAVPSSSVQGVVLEFGLVGIIGLIAYVVSLFRRGARKTRTGRIEFQKFLLARMLLFALCMGALGFYYFVLEYPQILAFFGILMALALQDDESEAAPLSV